MKTYLLSIPQRLKQQSATLDVKALLCNNAWDIINNDGQKQMFLFHNDGSLVVSTNGNVSICEWRLEPLAGTIVISSKDHAEMFKAGMVQKILVLAKDGSNEVLSLIDSKNTEIIPNRTVNELTAYLNYQDRLIEENIQRDRIVAEQQRTLEEENKRKEEYERLQLESAKQFEIEKLTNFCRENRSEICQEYRKGKKFKIAFFVSLFLEIGLISISIHLSLCCADSLGMALLYIFGLNTIGAGLVGISNRNLSRCSGISSIIRTKYRCKYACTFNLSDIEIISIAKQILEIDFK